MFSRIVRSVVEGFMFLGVVAEFEAMSGHDAPRVGFDAGQKKRRLVCHSGQARLPSLGPRS